MKASDTYRGREQTYIKHLFLERYLERVVYNIASFRDEFVYVDGFSGPWRSRDESFDDTSFQIAIRKLREVRDGVERRGRALKIRCLFIEKDPAAYNELSRYAGAISDVSIETLNGEFEHLVPHIARYVGNSFSLVFIDPTGWTGFGLDQIQPILNMRGEVLVNFMYDDINRHLLDERPEVSDTFAPLFGRDDWREEIAKSIAQHGTREEAVVDLYCRSLRSAGGFQHVTYTRIQKPLSDRTYFHLVYGTRHWKGLVEFRATEEKVVDIQEQVRDAAKQEHRIERTGQGELFTPVGNADVSRSFREHRDVECARALSEFRAELAKRGRISYEESLAIFLEHPTVWESDVKRWLPEMRHIGEIEILGMSERQRIPKRGNIVVWKR